MVNYHQSPFFDRAISIVLKHEGGYSNDPNDSGGETNFGITQKELSQYHEALGIAEDVKYLTENDAKLFYYKIYWSPYHYDSLLSINISIKLLDLSVNLGNEESTLIVQRALNRLGLTLRIDGLFGQQTRETINKAINEGDENQLLALIRYEAIQVYEMIVRHHPNDTKFEQGWLIRACY